MKPDEKNWSQYENDNRIRHFSFFSRVLIPILLTYLLISYFVYPQDSDPSVLAVYFALFGILACLAIVGVKTKKISLIAPISAFLYTTFIIPEICSIGHFELGNTIWLAIGVLYIAIVVEGKFKILLYFASVVMACVVHFYYADVSDRLAEPVLKDYIVSYTGDILACVIIVVMVAYELRLQKETARKTYEQAVEIEELNRAQNRFFSSMSHEIRTPINTIIGMNEMILREDISDEVADDARNIQNASKILLSLINDILDMSKIESGRMDIVSVPYDVGGMMSDIVNMIWIKANEKGLKFSVDIDPSMPAQLYCDEVRIKQILINLLNNAVKYTREGSVSLSVHCRKTEGGKVLVTYTVDDTGMGIRRESIPHLFDAFRREDVEKNRYIEGTGLGLSIVKQLVELLGGEISVSSVYTKGSSFTVSIEQEVADERAIGRYDPAKLHTEKRRKLYHQSFEAPDARVLIVDDNSANLMVAEKLLRDTKVMTDRAESGKEALNLCLKNEYNLIFMDHMMPEMDGVECLHAIREQTGGLNKSTPVVALTANAGSENQALYSREGFDDYILKPVEGSVLEAALQKFLPEDLVHAFGDEKEKYASEDIVREMRKKKPLLITTDSVADLPAELLARLGIPEVSYRVHMNDAVFTDRLEAQGDVLIRYLEDKGVYAKSEAPDVAEYENFFSEQLTGAQHIIHISTAKYASHGFANATEASLAFYNVKVIDSGQLSSGTGLSVLAARELVEKGVLDEEELLNRLEKINTKISTSFIVDTTEFLYRGGRLSEKVHKLCHAFMLHPVIVLKNSSMKVGSIVIGSRERARDKYIRDTLKDPGGIDTSVLFITYAGMKKSEIEEIRKKVCDIVAFDKVYLQKASPAISINCGPGTFGLLFRRRV